MGITRRSLLTYSTAALAMAAVGPSAVHAGKESHITCLAFDAFAVFDPRPIGALAEQLFPGRGGELMNLWRTRQFEYTWLRTSAQRYADFWQVTGDALTYATRAMKLDLTDDARRQSMEMYLKLNAYGDVVSALKSLRAAGLRLAFLSNFTAAMLDACIRTSKLDGLFEFVLSTDAAKAFKPAPAAYQMAIDAFKVRREEILFVPFAPWDAAGAKWFGFKTFWVNRQHLPAEQLDAPPADGMGDNLGDLAKFLHA